MTAHCPTCGCPIKVGGKGTTKYYVPARTEAAERLVGAAKLILTAITFSEQQAALGLLESALDAVEAEKEERDEKV
jgi:hypothetical protein